MEFPQPIKKQAREKAGFRCCLCHEVLTFDVHHIDPDKGNDFDNAVALCCNCHRIYGGDPKNRPLIIQARNWWYEHVAITHDYRKEEMNIIRRLEDKMDKVASQTDVLPMMGDFIIDTWDKVNMIYEQAKQKDYEGLANNISSASDTLSTVSSGMAIISSGLVDSYGKNVQVVDSPKIMCYHCNSSFDISEVIDEKWAPHQLRVGL